MELEQEHLTMPLPTLVRRKVDKHREKEGIHAGLDPLIARIVASRPYLEVCPKSLLEPKLKMLDSPNTLPDSEKACTRLILALENNEIIGIETDHDCDGQTAHAVIFTALTEYFGHPVDRVRSYIGHRLKEGYGLSEAVVKRILLDEPRPSLIITADNGSSDEPRIAELKQAGIDVIVTDHHEIPQEGIPQSAFAVINPIREGSVYPDKCIAGCMVAWLFMAAVRQLLVSRGRTIPSLGACLDFVAVGTIADCVSMARSRNNRAVVVYGMKLIQQGTRPCWRALLPILSSPVSSEDLGFKIGPLLNSDGRLACAFGSVSFLLAESEKEAIDWITHLQTQNQERKVIQGNITKMAEKQALMQYGAGKMSLCVFLEDGHAGVHGISASRIKEAFGRPIVIFCPKEDNPNVLTGSSRSIEGLHLRDVLQKIHDNHPGVIVRFGGHQGAAGLTIWRDQLHRFAQSFEEIVSQSVLPSQIGPKIFTDGELPIEYWEIRFIQNLIEQLEPFGREFEAPLFEIQGTLLSLTPMGKTPIHARVGLVVEGVWMEAVWFNVRKAVADPWPINLGDQVRGAISPKVQTFRGEKKLNCQVVYLEGCS